MAPVAHAAPVSSLSVQSDELEYTGQGLPRVAHPGGPVVSAEPTTFAAGGIALRAPADADGLFIEIAPPLGETLRPDDWTRVDGYRSRARAGRDSRCGSAIARATR